MNDDDMNLLTGASAWVFAAIRSLAITATVWSISGIIALIGWEVGGNVRIAFPLAGALLFASCSHVGFRHGKQRKFGYGATYLLSIRAI